MTTNHQKKNMRREFLVKRESIDPDLAKSHSRQICTWIHRWLCQSETGLKVRWVGCFASHRGEPDLGALYATQSSGLSNDNRAYVTALPVITVGDSNGPQMDFYSFKEGDPVTFNKYGIKEPHIQHARHLTPEDPGQALILVPALAVDREGHRLGYGGGFYDRYLARYLNVVSFGVIFEEFVLSELPAETHDQRLSGFVTQKGFTFLKNPL